MRESKSSACSLCRTHTYHQHMYLICCYCTGAGAAQQICLYCPASLLCIVHTIVAWWNDKERLQALVLHHAVQLQLQRSCNSFHNFQLRSWVLHYCYEQNAASVMTIVMQTCSIKEVGVQPVWFLASLDYSLQGYNQLPVLYTQTHLQV